MANVKLMEDYFKNMAKGNIGKSEMYVINQKGRGIGIGNSRRGKALYKINQSGGSKVNFVSPVTQSIVQAKSKLTKGGKRKKSAIKSQSAKRIRGVKKSSKKKRKSNKKKKNIKKKRKDIFS